jgi:ribosome-associated protein
MTDFDLDGHEFIELNKLMKLLGLVGSGGEANVLIDQGNVIVNDVVETRRRKKLRPGDKVVFHETSIVIR